MKSATIRTFQTVHTWTGLIAGFALFVAFYAGALTVFHDDIAAWQNPPWRSAQDAHVPISSLIDHLIAQHPETRDDFGIVLPSDDAHAAYAYWQDKDNARFATASEMTAPSDVAGRGDLADFVYALHDSLGLPVVGLYVMGIVSVLYGLALVSGLLIHLPQLAKDLFAMRVGHNMKRLWQDAHNAIGVLSLPFHFIFAATGSILCLFTLTLAALNVIAFDGKLFGSFAQAIATAPTVAASGTPAVMLTPEQLIERASAAALATGVTSFEPDYLHYTHYGDRNAVVEVRGLSQHTLGTYGTVALSGDDGRVLATHVGAKLSINGISNSSLYALHFGSYGGRTVRLAVLRTRARRGVPVLFGQPAVDRVAAQAAPRGSATQYADHGSRHHWRLRGHLPGHFRCIRRHFGGYASRPRRGDIATVRLLWIVPRRLRLRLCATDSARGRRTADGDCRADDRCGHYRPVRQRRCMEPRVGARHHFRTRR